MQCSNNFLITLLKYICIPVSVSLNIHLNIKFRCRIVFVTSCFSPDVLCSIRDDTLLNHIKFLESHDIAGVSHHSLLFSKTAVVPLVHESNEVLRSVSILS